MNKKIINIIIVGFLLFSCNSTRSKECETSNNDSISTRVSYFINYRLTSEEYKEYKTYVPDEGYIPNAEIAFNIAEAVLCQIFGKVNINNQKPFSVNLFRDVWIVEGSLNCIGCEGGVAYIEIQKSDGKILKVVHTK